MKNKNNIPNYRKDIASQNFYPKQELLRIVKNKNNQIYIDKNYSINGRGVYIKPDLESLKIAKQKNLIAKSLKTKVDLLIYEMIEKEIENHG